MAVQKSKKSRSKRNSRRSNNYSLFIPVLYFNKKNKEYSLYHNISKKGFYKNKKYKI